LKGKRMTGAKKSKGILFVVSAPSGAGKTSLCKSLVSTMRKLEFSVSMTTRAPRPGEVNDADYTFVSREAFHAMIGKEEFVEWAEVHGELYGTSKERLEAVMGSGKDILLDIDTQGAAQIREKHDEGVFVFVLPPSMEALRDRLMKRRTDSEETISRRLKTAVSEIRTYGAYDYVIINDIFQEALLEFKSIIAAERARSERIEPRWVEEAFPEGRI
jgi:guanylate kinase